MRAFIWSAVLGVGALGLFLGTPSQVSAQVPVIYGSPYTTYYPPAVGYGYYRPRIYAPRTVVYPAQVYRSYYVPSYPTYYPPVYYTTPAPVTYYTPSYYPPVYVPPGY